MCGRRAAGEQRLEAAGAAPRGGIVEGVLAVAVDQLQVGARLDEELQRAEEAVRGGEVQGSDASLIRGVDVDVLLLEEAHDHLELVELHRRVEQRAALLVLHKLTCRLLEEVLVHLHVVRVEQRRPALDVHVVQARARVHQQLDARAASACRSGVQRPAACLVGPAGLAVADQQLGDVFLAKICGVVESRGAELVGGPGGSTVVEEEAGDLLVAVGCGEVERLAALAICAADAARDLVLADGVLHLHDEGQASVLRRQVDGVLAVHVLLDGVGAHLEETVEHDEVAGDGAVVQEGAAKSVRLVHRDLGNQHRHSDEGVRVSAHRRQVHGSAAVLIAVEGVGNRFDNLLHHLVRACCCMERSATLVVHALERGVVLRQQEHAALAAKVCSVVHGLRAALVLRTGVRSIHKKQLQTVGMAGAGNRPEEGGPATVVRLVNLCAVGDEQFQDVDVLWAAA
mmetsp:Transcript_3348/g.11779  ORF Transcript_3348/g.11779 Transcript_3348/m.11779 type:complete len:456 (+) Transcript_3348:2639-4006(+)